MKQFPIQDDQKVEAAADLWFNQWVEESAMDFDPIDLEEFILID